VTSGRQLAGDALLMGALALTVFLQRVQLELRREEAAKWWASNGRDLVNLLSLGAIYAGMRVLGLPSPSALILAATLLLGLHLFETFLLRRPRTPAPTALSLGFALLAALPVLLWPLAVHEALRAAASRVAG
jgi:hypothetical protein